MEDIKAFKNELQNIIEGKSSSGESNSIHAAKTYLGNYTPPGEKSESSKPDRAEEERTLREYAQHKGLWVQKKELGNFITAGAEQRIYYKENDIALFKISDAIFYENWTDYFNSLLLHNCFFPDTSYSLIGFLDEEGKFFAVLRQQFVLLTDKTNLQVVKEYLLANGFVLKKNNDYYHPYLGIILEDLHDENVLTSNGELFFIDTVFYLTEQFYFKE